MRTSIATFTLVSSLALSACQGGKDRPAEKGAADTAAPSASPQAGDVQGTMKPGGAEPAAKPVVADPAAKPVVADPPAPSAAPPAGAIAMVKAEDSPLGRALLDPKGFPTTDELWLYVHADGGEPERHCKAVATTRLKNVLKELRLELGDVEPTTKVECAPAGGYCDVVRSDTIERLVARDAAGTTPWLVATFPLAMRDEVPGRVAELATKAKGAACP